MIVKYKRKMDNTKQLADLVQKLREGLGQGDISKIAFEARYSVAYTSMVLNGEREINHNNMVIITVAKKIYAERQQKNEAKDAVVDELKNFLSK